MKLSLDTISARIWGLTEDDARKLREYVAKRPRVAAQRFLHAFIRGTGPKGTAK